MCAERVRFRVRFRVSNNLLWKKTFILCQNTMTEITLLFTVELSTKSDNFKQTDVYYLGSILSWAEFSAGAWTVQGVE